MDFLPLLVIAVTLLVAQHHAGETGQGNDSLIVKLLVDVGRDVGALKIQVKHLQGQLDQEKIKVRSLQTQLNRTRAESIPLVAFTVTRTSKIPAPSHRTNVHWQHVITNVGGAWDQTVGQFRAPVAGLYAFHLTAPVNGNRWINLYLMKNGHDVTTAHGTGRYAAEGSTHVVLDLNKSDTVLVQLGAGQSLFGDMNLRPVFTGYLIATKP